MSKTRIMELTPEQKVALPQCRETWRRVGLCTDPVLPEAARAAVRALYVAGGLPEPKAIFILSSPMMCLLARGVVMSLLKKSTDAASASVDGKLGDQLGGQLWDQLGGQLWDQLGGQLGDQLRGQLWGQLGDQLWGQLGDQLGGQLWDQLGGQLRDQLWGQLGDQLGGQLGDQLGGQLWGQLFQSPVFVGSQDAYWLAFYDFTRDIGVGYEPRTDAHLLAYRDYALRCGWMYAYKDIAFVSDRPSEIHFDQGGRLHSKAGMAVRFRDGWGLCAWHGLRLPESREWIVRESARLSAEAIDQEENAEFRRVMLEAYGFDKYLAERGAKVIDRDDPHGRPRELLRLDGRDKLHVVRVLNGSLEPDGTRREFVLGAARRSGARAAPRSAHEAIAASYGINPKAYREAVRT